MKDINNHMVPDKFGRSTIQSLYFDTDTDLLVRTSLDKPLYKEKLRLRSYGIADMDDKVFLEIKKKYNGIVYKRRISLKQSDVEPFINGKLNLDNQIGNELNYFRDYYKTLKPSTLLIYDREAYFDGELRVTFDHNIKYRKFDLTLDKGFYGNNLIEPEQVLMEIKVNGAMPFWLVEALEMANAYKTSFSKYGLSYMLVNQSLALKNNAILRDANSPAFQLI
jgi:SPX domain protein involved in polyphosphate accumulation